MAAKSEMELLQNELAATNRSLEKKVKKRTEELEEINLRIIAHGFTHTKTIIDPLDKLELVTNQMSKDPASAKKELSRITSQLDDIIMSINNNLSTDESKLYE